MSETLTTSSLSEEQEHYSKPSPHSSSEMKDDGSAEKCADISTEERDFLRAEIDTSAPFESVKEAASRFGGIGFWKPRRGESERGIEDIHIFEVEKQKALLTDRLVEKESETLDVLKELERTKKLAGELKSRLQKDILQDAGLKANAAQSNGLSDLERLDIRISDENYSDALGSMYSYPAPEVILMELNQEKMNDASVTKASIELLNERIKNERNAFEMTRKRLAANSLNISSLEKELNQTRKNLELVKHSRADDNVSDNPMKLSKGIQRLSSETDEFKIRGEAVKSELFSAMLEIEQTKSRIKIAEMSLVAVNKMKESAKIAEEAALSELQCIRNCEHPTNDDYVKPEGVSLSQEEYEALVAKAKNAEELLNKRVLTAMLEVDEANVSKMETLMKLAKATEEVKMTKIVMENTLRRVEAATMGKLAVEESLRQRRSVHSQKRRTLSNSTKFKTVGPSQYRKESSLLDVNGMSIVSNDSVPVSRPTLSIGQILNNKLQHLDQPEAEMNSDKRALKRNESLGQMLGKRDEQSDFPISGKVEKEDDLEQPPRKSGKFTFARFSLQLATLSQKKKTRTAPRFMMCNGQA